MRGEGNIFHLRQRVIRLQRLGVENVEPDVADVPALERLDQRRLVDQRAARGIDQDRARLHARDALGAQESAGRVIEHQVEGDHIGVRQQCVELAERHASAARPVPTDHVHADTLADARHLAPDTAEPDHAQRLAVELHAFLRRPHARAHLAVHAGHVTRGGEHQCNRMLGHGGVAIALDGVHGDAAALKLIDIHVAGRAGAEEHDVLERRALRHQLGRHSGVVVERDRVAFEQAR